MSRSKLRLRGIENMLSLLHKDHLIPSAAYGVICGWQSLLGYPDISVRNLCGATNANNNKLANVQDSVASIGCSSKQLEWEGWSRSIPPPLADVDLIPPSGESVEEGADLSWFLFPVNSLC